MKRHLVVLAILVCVVAVRLQAQTVSFNFSSAAQSVSGWTNIHGNPASGPLSGSASGVTVSSIAGGNWAGYSGNCSADGGGATGGTFFPAAVMANHWFQYSSFYAAYNAAMPQLQISGLNKDSVYTIKMTGSFSQNIGVFELNPIRYTVAGSIIYGYIDINGDNNTSDGATFHNIAPDAGGNVKIYVNTFENSNTASICGLQIITGHTTAPTPVVSFTHPANNTIAPEDASIVLSANATETGGTIARVEFYANDVLLASDSAAPYSYTWANADPGSYTLKIRAVDGTGNTSTMTENITVQSLNYFWSTTGQIATGGDTAFVGTVDTNRLAFRTNNIERMSLSKTGSLTIGGKDTASHPAFRVYPNGDVVAGTTMDRSVNTNAQVGMRYYSKLGIMQIGASDQLDTTKSNIVYGTFPSSGLIINTDDANIIKGRMMNTVFAGDGNTVDSLVGMENVIVASENSHFANGIGKAFNVILSGYGMNISAPVTNTLLSGNGNTLSKPVDISNINGFANTTADTAIGSLINGAFNQFGGSSQLVSGEYLINRAPFGTILGNSNVDFPTLSYTGRRQVNVPGLNQYPLFAIGNSASGDGSVRSNALTILYNGRAQINTTGHTASLTQAAVTPQAALDVVSTNSGVLLPRLTNAQRNAIAAGDLHNGLLLYNTDSSVFQYYNGSAWNSVGSGGSGSGGSKWNFSSGTTGIVYDVSDNVGIGTTDTKGYRLAVNGSAIFTSVKVKPAGSWPDYVFRKGYRLPGLGELEQYIQKHRHLPGIVAADEAERFGIDLGENQAAMLKKVEELTLYLIDENKELKDQNVRLTEQDKKMGDLQRQIDELKALLQKK